MASTVKTYVGDGSTTIYTFEFDYISKSFVKVLVDGDPVGFTLSGTYQVTLDEAPAAGTVIVIQRETDTDRIVEFVDGSVLVAKDLNISSLQATHIAAEALNKAGGSMLIDETGAYSAGFRRLAKIGDPVNANDAVTKEWAETAQSAQLAQTITAQNAATTAKTAAEAARDAAISARDAAQTAEANAGASETAAETAETNAAASASAAATSASNAATSESNAAASASAAATSEANAAASAAAAATFDPSDYYDKAEADGRFLQTAPEPDVVLLNEAAVVAAASADFTLDIANYQIFRVVVFGFHPSNDGTALWMRWSGDGGSSFYTGGYDFGRVNSTANGAGGTQFDGQSQFPILSSSGNAANEYGAVEALILGASSPGGPTLVSQGTYSSTITRPSVVCVSGRRDTSAINAIRIQPASGTFDAVIKLYGVK